MESCGTVETVIGDADDMVFVGSASDGETAVLLVVERRPDVVLMDLSMPGGIDGIEATKRILAERPSTRVVIFTADDAQSFAGHEKWTHAIDAGAVSYVVKDCAPEVLRSAVRAAVALQS